jgi:hypothetical protein
MHPIFPGGTSRTERISSSGPFPSMFSISTRKKQTLFKSLNQWIAWTSQTRFPIMLCIKIVD